MKKAEAEVVVPKVEIAKPQIAKLQSTNKYLQMGFATDASELLQELDESW